MSNSLLLPKLETISYLEGKGNFAVRKYYKWPERIFYRHKLKMILDLMDVGRVYKSTLDFGAGPAKILEKSLKSRSWKYTAIDHDDAQPIDKFDLIVCGSVLEFVNLDETLKYFKSHLLNGGHIIGASPMDTALSRFYFKKIGDSLKRNNHKSIMQALKKHFHVVDNQEWLGLYFSFKATQK